MSPQRTDDQRQLRLIEPRGILPTEHSSASLPKREGKDTLQAELFTERPSLGLPPKGSEELLDYVDIVQTNPDIKYTKERSVQ